MSKQKKQLGWSITRIECFHGSLTTGFLGILRVLMGFLNVRFVKFNELVNKPILIHCDNLSSIQLTKNLVFHAQTKHIEVHYHYIHEHILAGDIDLQYVGTNMQVADIFRLRL